MWQSRKTLVNHLKATIAKQRMTNDDEKKIDENVNNMEMKVEIQEIIDVLTLAEQDIIRNLNDSLSRFKRTEEFRHWISENMNAFGLNT